MKRRGGDEFGRKTSREEGEKNFSTERVSRKLPARDP